MSTLLICHLRTHKSSFLHSGCLASRFFGSLLASGPVLFLMVKILLYHKIIFIKLGVKIKQTQYKTSKILTHRNALQLLCIRLLSAVNSNFLQVGTKTNKNQRKFQKYRQETHVYFFTKTATSVYLYYTHCCDGSRSMVDTSQQKGKKARATDTNCNE